MPEKPLLPEELPNQDPDVPDDVPEDPEREPELDVNPDDEPDDSNEELLLDLVYSMWKTGFDRKKFLYSEHSLLSAHSSFTANWMTF